MHKSTDVTTVLVRHVWDDAKERVDSHRLTSQGKNIYARRKGAAARSFAGAKELHGHRYARFRDLEKVRAQCLMAAAAQNIKKIARLLPQLLWPLDALATMLKTPVLAWITQITQTTHNCESITSFALAAPQTTNPA